MEKQWYPQKAKILLFASNLGFFVHILFKSLNNYVKTVESKLKAMTVTTLKQLGVTNQIIDSNESECRWQI